MITMGKNLGTIGETPYGSLPKGAKNKNSCDACQRAFCLEVRIDNEPQTLLVEGREDILQCPVCGHVIDMGGE